ncbi:chitin synthase [Boeremia exigua]|uniref:chitin synthase n=1 Tax=Boeremia exigua TaxID=749465 RepID=UPI001E8CE3AD|nr:chitin synthase [Boeremia exigua]KAH6644894.1 chitin synthase [Boeremia exigua]
MKSFDTKAPSIHTAIELTNAPIMFQPHSLATTSKTLRTVFEHLPSVDLRRLKFEKYVACSLLGLANLSMAYMFQDYTRFFWYLFPLVMIRPLVDIIEITIIIVSYLVRRLHPPNPKIPAIPENFVYLLCCYNETYQEIMTSLRSLAEQKMVDAHKKAILVVCDGRASSKGMTKTAAAHLKDDIIERPSSVPMSQAYTAWDGVPMDAEIIKGEFRGVPIICIIKNENRGKRDGIVLARSFFHKFNHRDSKPPLAMMSPRLFAELSDFLEKASIRSIDYAIGIDADTRFDLECVSNLIQTVREDEKIVGVTGHIRADPIAMGQFSISYLYQNAEYTVGQYRRRLRQNLTSGRVTCLPGCCQLLRVLESTCGDDILQKFGYYPKPSDGLFRTIRSMMSEDRDHVCLVLSENADVQTRVCHRARAYTTAPQTLSVFLSQRRRWTLGPLTSDSLLISRRKTGWMERLAVFTSLLHWVVNPALFFVRFYFKLDRQTKLWLFFLGRYRNAWDLLVAILASTSVLDAVQLCIGSMMYSYFIPFVNFVVQFYTLYKLDDFTWGKTRVGVEARVE